MERLAGPAHGAGACCVIRTCRRVTSDTCQEQRTNDGGNAGHLCDALTAQQREPQCQQHQSRRRSGHGVDTALFARHPQ